MKEKIYISGFHAIEESLRSGAAGGRLFYCRVNPRIEKLLRLAESRRLPLEQAEPAVLDRLAGAGKYGKTPRQAGAGQGRKAGGKGELHRGILLELPGNHAGPAGPRGKETTGPAGLDKAKNNNTKIKGSAGSSAAAVPGKAPATAAPGMPAAEIYRGLRERERALVLLLDGITDPQNLGAILRSGDKFAVDLVIIPQRGAARTTAAVASASAGASAWMPLLEQPNLSRCIRELKDWGFWVFGAQMDGQPAWNVEFPEKTALVMGGEGRGLHRLVEEGCDALVSIPAAGHVDSFNVSVAAGILLYEVRRQEAFRREALPGG